MELSLQIAQCLFPQRIPPPLKVYFASSPVLGFILIQLARFKNVSFIYNQ